MGPDNKGIILGGQRIDDYGLLVHGLVHGGADVADQIHLFAEIGRM
jgi:hypothetical protein